MFKGASLCGEMCECEDAVLWSPAQEGEEHGGQIQNLQQGQGVLGHPVREEAARLYPQPLVKIKSILLFFTIILNFEVD